MQVQEKKEGNSIERVCGVGKNPRAITSSGDEKYDGRIDGKENSILHTDDDE